MLRKLALVILVLSASFALGQGSCIPGQAITSRLGFSNLAAVVPQAQVAVSPGPIFTDQTDTTQAPNPSTADAVGNYNICAAQGSTQTITVSGPNMNTLVYKLTFPAVVQQGASLSGNNIFTGNNTFSGGLVGVNETLSGTLTVGTVNSGPITASTAQLSGAITQVGGVNTTGTFGVPIVIYATASASGNTTISPVTMTTVGATGSLYRFSMYLVQSVVGTGCSTNTTILPAVTVTDPLQSGTDTISIAINNGTGNTVAIMTIVNNGAINGSQVSTFPVLIRGKVGTTITYGVTVTGGTCTTVPSFVAIPFLELLN